MTANDLNAPFLDSAEGILLDPKDFTVYDNGGMTPDRYSVLPFLHDDRAPRQARGMILALSSEPAAQGGVSEWTHVRASSVDTTLALGTRLHWEDLPGCVRQHVRDRIEQESLMIAQIEGLAPAAPRRPRP